MRGVRLVPRRPRELRLVERRRDFLGEPRRPRRDGRARRFHESFRPVSVPSPSRVHRGVEHAFAVVHALVDERDGAERRRRARRGVVAINRSIFEIFGSASRTFALGARACFVVFPSRLGGALEQRREFRSRLRSVPPLRRRLDLVASRLVRVAIPAAPSRARHRARRASSPHRRANHAPVASRRRAGGPPRARCARRRARRRSDCHRRRRRRAHRVDPSSTASASSRVS